MELVRGRLLLGLKFFDGTKRIETWTREQVKLALLIVRIANPKEDMTAKEVEIMEGGQRKVEVSSAQIGATKARSRATKK